MINFEARIAALRAAPYDSSAAGALHGLKIEAAAALSPSGAAAAFVTALGHGAETTRLRFGSLFSFARERDAIMAITHPGGNSAIESPIVRGERRASPSAVWHRPVSVIRLNDAWVTGRSSMVRVNDVLLADYHATELTAWPTDFRFDPMPFDQPADTVLAFLGPEDGPPLDEAISLVGVTSYNFGHWIVEYLMRLSELRTAGLADGVPILIDAGITATQREALDLCCEGRHPIIEVQPLAARFVRRLWLPTNLCYVPIMPQRGTPITVNYISPDPAYAARLIRRMFPSLPPAPCTPRRIFLARKTSLHRKLLNQEEVIAAARAADFEVFYPEEHDFGFQLALARNAEMIIGPEGSQLLLAMFARPGTRLLILNHPFLENLPTFTHALHELGILVEVLPGVCVREDPTFRKFSDYHICRHNLEEVIDEWRNTSPFVQWPQPFEALRRIIATNLLGGALKRRGRGRSSLWW